MTAIVVYCTTASSKEARTLADALVNEKLAACVSIVPSVSSTYWWQGKIEKADEQLLVIKTLLNKFNRLSRRIKAIHSYSVPEILALPVKAGNPAYLKWMADSLHSKRRKSLVRER